MSWPRIFAYYLIAALLSWHLMGVTAEQESASGPAVASSEPFLTAIPERIDRLRLEEGAVAVQFEKRDGRWVATEPEGLAPPGDVIDAILESLTSLPAIEIVSEGVEHEGQFGLTPPRARIRIEQQGELISTIVLGELSPTRTAVYAKKSGKDEVALIGLNTKYYIDLVFENVRRQLRSAGVALPEAAEPEGAETVPAETMPAETMPVEPGTVAPDDTKPSDTLAPVAE